MKTSTEFNSAAQIVGEERAVELIAKAGFDAWDFSLYKMWKWDFDNQRPFENNHPLGGREYLAHARKLKQIGVDNGIVCNQSHAPFPTRFAGKDVLMRALEITAEAGGKICIIHPDNYAPVERNAEMYFEILPFAKQCDVKIATENMFNWDMEAYHALPAACSSPESFMAHLNAVNDPDFVACLDLGHSELEVLGTSAVEMIETLGSKIQALHIHDNNKRRDNHQIPGSANIKFKPISKALKSIGYNGYYTLEAYNHLKDFAKEDVLSGLSELRESLNIFD